MVKVLTNLYLTSTKKKAKKSTDLSKYLELIFRLQA
jgi:hypothetical protein